MHEHLVALEERMQQLRYAIRQALAQHEAAQIGTLHAELRRSQQAWEVLCGLNGAPSGLPPKSVSPSAPSDWSGPRISDLGRRY
ncbi:hypothetical protein [Streptomyces sp. NPDC047315]|uniref:hypothetical protein n=1 Tax=Streptomyces sp. NPDC047315 TaxID=3155142 RepID=UPI0033CCACE9